MAGSHPEGGPSLIVTTIDLPYPPNYGHKVDQYNRWKGFAERGWRLKLICWRSPQDPPTGSADVEALRGVFDEIDVLPIRHDAMSFARRLALLPRYPSHVASRIPDAATRTRLIAEARAFRPSAVVHDGIYGAALGNELARACGVPTIVRGHNVEHVYFAQQARAVKDLRSKLAWTIARLGLARWERKVMRDAAWSFQISTDDVAYWQRQGIGHVSWAPTVYPARAQAKRLPPAARPYDVAYIGNMRLPNNLQGLAWFVREVLPELRQLRPGVTLCFAGANPGEEARTIFAAAPDIALIPDAPDADAILDSGRVLVNPILSGSGVNVKSIDMLRHDAPIVTTPIGVQGFPAELRNQFAVRSDPRSFAAAIAEALADPQTPTGRAEAAALFLEDGLEKQIASYANVIAGRRAEEPSANPQPRWTDAA